MKRAEDAEAGYGMTEFPEDIWTVIVSFIHPNNNDEADLPIMLNLLGTCKMMSRVLQQPVLLLLRHYLTFNAYYGDGSLLNTGEEVLFECVKAWSCFRQLNIVDYLERFLLLREERNAEQLSTALSIIRLARLEITNLYRWDGEAYIYQGLKRVFLPAPIVGEISYYNREKRQMEGLFHHRELVFVEIRDITIVDSAGMQMYLLMKEKADEKSIARIEKGYFPYEKLDCYMALLVKSGRPFSTRPVVRLDSLYHVMVNINGTYHWFYSTEASEIRLDCFRMPLFYTRKEMTTKYILETYASKHRDIVASLITTQ